MGNRTELLKEAMPLITKLVWPVFVCVLLLAFGSEARDLYDLVKKRVEHGASVKVGGFLELGELARKTEVGQLSIPDLRIEAIGGAAGTVGKGSPSALESLRSKIQREPRQRVDTLRIDDRKQYSPALLKDYVTSLGVRFVIFEKKGRFDGWIDAGLFLGQLPVLTPAMAADTVVDYAALQSRIVGIDTEHVQHTDTARQVLSRMQALHVEQLPVLKNEQFAFFASRGEILSSLISQSLTAEQ